MWSLSLLPSLSFHSACHIVIYVPAPLPLCSLTLPLCSHPFISEKKVNISLGFGWRAPHNGLKPNRWCPELAQCLSCFCITSMKERMVNEFSSLIKSKSSWVLQNSGLFLKISPFLPKESMECANWKGSWRLFNPISSFFSEGATDVRVKGVNDQHSLSHWVRAGMRTQVLQFNPSTTLPWVLTWKVGVIIINDKSCHKDLTHLS